MPFPAGSMTQEHGELAARALDGFLRRGTFALIEWAPDKPWPVRLASPSCERVLGWTAEQLMDPYFHYATIVHPEDLERVGGEMSRALEDGVDDFFHEDYRIERPDGRIISVSDHTFVERVDGRVVALRGYLSDVTQHHERRAQLQEKEERLRLVLEGTRLGIWDWNPKTGAVTFDERWAEMLGHRLDEIPFVVDSWSERVHPDDLEACFADLERHMAGETDFYENVHRMRHKSGQWRYILDRGRVMERDEEGNPIRFTGTHTDITDQKRAELAAHEANRLKTMFLATMSHEIRTPLNGVLGLLQLVDDQTLPSDQQRYLRLIRQSSESLLVIVNDLLDVSKLEAHAIELDTHEFDFERVIESSVELFRAHAAEKQIGLRWEHGQPKVGWVLGDGHRLRQVLTNLVSNAVKFTDEGEVVVRSWTEGGARCLEVRDTGAGMSDTSRIWQPFRQESAGTARRHGGTGLGLTIVRELTRLMGGSVEVTSEPGQGTRFGLRFEFPAARSPSRGEGAGEEIRFAPAQMKVLIAEDNHVNQVVVQGALSKLGVDAHLARDGREAVQAAEKEDFDVILMDLHMPNLDGIDATREIRALPRGDRPRIIALTADALSEHRDAALAAGMDGFLSKPFRIAQLREQLTG